MSGKYYALKLSLLILTSLSFGLALAYLWARPSANAERGTPSIALLSNDKDQDGLAGPVNQTRIETAKLLDKAGKLSEGPRQLMGFATYDQKGNRIEGAHYLVAANSYSGRQEYDYDEKGNIVGMTVRDANNSIVGKETYRYELDSVGNWTKMTTSRVVSEAGKETSRPDEVTYRSITYYFDKNIAGAVTQNTEREASNPSSVEAVESADSETDRPEGEMPETFAALRRSLYEWVKANNARDVDKELSFYAPKLFFYYRSRNVTRETVRRDKARMFERADLIDVRAGAPEITLERDGKTAIMRFRKQYVVKVGGSVHSGEVLQELRWERTDEGWRIIGERDVQEIR